MNLKEGKNYKDPTSSNEIILSAVDTPQKGKINEDSMNFMP